MSERFFNYIDNHRWRTLFFFSIFAGIISLISILIGASGDKTRILLYIAGSLFLISTLGSFWEFYTGEARFQQKINSLHGRSFLSSFYRIYFPIIIISIVLQFLIIFALTPRSSKGWGAIDPSISPSGRIVFIIPSIIIGIGIIALADFEMKKKDLLYAPRGKQYSYLKSLIYMSPLLGLYFGIRFLVKFILIQSAGKGVLIPISQNFYTIDANLINAARFWIFLTKKEKILTLVGFLSIYLAMEVLLRGLIANEARSFNLGPGGRVFIPAVIQAVAFSSGSFLFTDTIYYLYTLFEAFFLGLITGIVLWRTGRFSATITIALLARALDNSLDFYTTLLHLLPESFGSYDPADSIVTKADNIGVFLVYIQFILVIVAPLMIIVAYDEVWKITSSLYKDFKSQWFGYLVIAIAFFIIDMIFSYFAPVVGFIISMIIVGIIINYFFRVLPPPLHPEDAIPRSDPFQGEYSININSDIRWLERHTRWYENPKITGILGSLLFTYLLFISGVYRYFSIFSSNEILTYVIFLIILPTILFGLTSYFLTSALARGYYFSDDNRNTIFGLLFIVYLVNLYIWTVSSSLAQFAWRNIPFFVIYGLLIWQKPIRSPLRDYAIGLAKGGRYATFRNVKYNPSLFIKLFDKLIELPSDTIKVGVHILGAELELLNEWDQIEKLRNANSDKGMNIGGAFVLGIIGTPSSEGILLQLLNSEDIDTKIAAFWALGKIGTRKALSKMSQVLEENPIKGLIEVGEKAILSIDPHYPIAGFRDAISI